LAGRIGVIVDKALPHKYSTATNTIIGAVGVLLVLILHWIRDDIERKIRAQIHLSDTLAPYFGHRLERAGRILKGSVRVSS
jgi:hypothetical protein